MRGTNKLLLKLVILMCGLSVFTNVYAASVRSESDSEISKNILLEYNQSYTGTAKLGVDYYATVMGTVLSLNNPVVKIVTKYKSGLLYGHEQSATITIEKKDVRYKVLFNQPNSASTRVKWTNIKSGTSVGGNYSAYTVIRD